METKVKENLKDLVSPLAEASRWGHEQVVFCQDQDVGLKAIIGIHDTTLGPSLGGVRLWNYQKEEDALRDVLRLSRGMTYKSSLAGLNLGGGKAVIISDVKNKSEALLRRFGQFVHTLGGRYWTAEDVNMNIRDMDYIRMETPHVVGLSRESGGSGNPSPLTAYGVYIAMKAAAKRRYGKDSLQGKTILIQGAAGSVGHSLAQLLAKELPELLISDIQEDRLLSLYKGFPRGPRFIPPDAVYDTPADIFAPCALGGVLNEDSISRMNFDIIVGAANNQLHREKEDAELLRSRDILYGPDFLVNSGGVISVAYEFAGKYDEKAVYSRIDLIYDTLLNVFKKADKAKLSSHQAAMKLAEERIHQIR
ncbi:MAG: leucine dehydrogenase, partial [Cytophagales bacterium]|nr:leucine dehydrogenase [Cytophagales bacterium]